MRKDIHTADIGYRTLVARSAVHYTPTALHIYFWSTTMELGIGRRKMVMQLLLDIIICHSIIGVPRHLSKGQCEEGGKWRWCCCCNFIKRLMSGTRRCMSTLLCSLFPSIHTNIISTLHILTLLLAPVKTSDKPVWRCSGTGIWIVNRKSIFSGFSVDIHI